MINNIDDIQKVLVHQRPLALRYHVKRLGVFGSFARGEARQESDVDLLVEYETPVSLMEHAGFANRLAALFERKVDLVTRNALKIQLKDAILNEVVQVASF